MRLARGMSLLGLVLFVRQAAADRLPRRDVLAMLTERFALPFDDARLVIDRVAGGAVRALSGNPANEPDRLKDPVAWVSYCLELGLAVDDEDHAPSMTVRASAEALLDSARRGEPTRGTDNVEVAIEAARQAVASQESDRVRFHLLLQAATSLSVAAEACIDRLEGRPCAAEGSQEWVDGVLLVAAAREVTASFAAQPDPELEERGLALVGRIVTGLLGQCRAFVGRAMLDSARCIRRRGEPERAASHVDAVLADFQILLDWFETEDPFDEHVLALEHLLAAVEFSIEVRGGSAELDDLRSRTKHALDRASAA